MPRGPVSITPVPLFSIVVLSATLYLSGSSVLSCMATVLTTTQQFGFIAAATHNLNNDLIESILVYSTLGNVLGSFCWGVLSDAFGRKFALIICLLTSLIFMMVRAFSSSLLLLPLISFISSTFNGSLVIVKAYAGDILDTTNSATGFTALGVCTMGINTIALVIDILLYTAISQVQKPSYLLLWPSIIEMACVISVILCVHFYFQETIRVKSYSGNTRSEDDNGRIAITGNQSMPTDITGDQRRNSNEMVGIGYRRLSSTSEDEDEEEDAAYNLSKYMTKKNKNGNTNDDALYDTRNPNNKFMSGNRVNRPPVAAVIGGIALVNSDKSNHNLRYGDSRRRIGSSNSDSNNSNSNNNNNHRMGINKDEYKSDVLHNNSVVTFYTSLWHSLLLPRMISDVDGDFPSFDGADHITSTNGEYTYYDDFSVWDIYRALIPLYNIFYTSYSKDFVYSLVAKAEAGGYLPIFPAWNSYTCEMIGDHGSVIIADAYQKVTVTFTTDTLNSLYLSCYILTYTMVHCNICCNFTQCLLYSLTCGADECLLLYHYVYCCNNNNNTHTHIYILYRVCWM